MIVKRTDCEDDQVPEAEEASVQMYFQYPTTKSHSGPVWVLLCNNPGRLRPAMVACLMTNPVCYTLMSALRVAASWTPMGNPFF